MRLFDVNMIRKDGNGIETIAAASINLSYLRAFYPREETRGNGTRLTFADGGGFAVANSFEEIKAAASAAGLRILDVNLAKPRRQEDNYRDSDDVYGDNDDLPLEAAPSAALAPDAAPAAPENPACINLEYVRAFYPRIEGQGPGTRLTFSDGGGFAVTNAHEDVRAALVGVMRPN